MKNRFVYYLGIFVTLVILCPKAFAQDKIDNIPIYNDSAWPVDVVSDLLTYSDFIDKQDAGKARSLRQAANRLKAARLLYPGYPRLKGKAGAKRYNNCLPTLEDLKLLTVGADSFPEKSPDKALYASIYCMRMIGRGDERYWKVAPSGPISESRKIVNDALKIVNENADANDPAKIPVLLAEAYFFMHSGRKSESFRIANQAISLAKNRFGAGSRQLVSTIKYASLIFTSSKKGKEFKRLLKYHRKISTDPFTRANTKADFYY